MGPPAEAGAINQEMFHLSSNPNFVTVFALISSFIYFSATYNFMSHHAYVNVILILFFNLGLVLAIHPSIKPFSFLLHISLPHFRHIDNV
jgi:hypothetical protein